MFNALALHHHNQTPAFEQHWSSPLSSSFPPKLCTDQTHRDAAAQHAASVGGDEDGRADVCFPYPTQEVQTLLLSLCKGCSFKEPGESACDLHLTTLELHHSVIGEERTAALPDLLRYSDIKDELSHFLSVKPFVHPSWGPRIFHWRSSQDKCWWAQDTALRGAAAQWEDTLALTLLERKVK